MINIGKRIRLLRERMGMSQYKLSCMMHINPQTIKYWELGIHMPRDYYLDDLARTLNTTKEYLMWGEQMSAKSLIDGKIIEKAIVTPRLDNTGYYIELHFTDNSTVRICDKILYKNFNNDTFKEIDL